MKSLAAIFTMTTAFAEPVPMTFKATDGTEVLYRFAAPEKMDRSTILKEVDGKAEMTMYPGVGHDSWTQTYKDPEAIKWLFAQKTPD